MSNPFNKVLIPQVIRKFSIFITCLFCFESFLGSCGQVDFLSATPASSSYPMFITSTPMDKTVSPSGVSTAGTSSNDQIETPTYPSGSFASPEFSPEAYRIKKRDFASAMDDFNQVNNNRYLDEYEDLYGFYKMSMLYEFHLDFPASKNDFSLLQRMTDYNRQRGISYALYGLVFG